MGQTKRAHERIQPLGRQSVISAVEWSLPTHTLPLSLSYTPQSSEAFLQAHLPLKVGFPFSGPSELPFSTAVSIRMTMSHSGALSSLKSRRRFTLPAGALTTLSGILCYCG